MAKRRRQRVTGLMPLLGRGLSGLFRWMRMHPAPFLVMGLVGAAGWGLCAAAPHADVFRVSQLSLPLNLPLHVPEPLIGTNLWQLDLRWLANELQRQQPWLKEVRVVRQLPNTIRIEPIQRVPVAQLRIDLPGPVGRWYLVDREAFILPMGSATPTDKLPRFIGCERSGVPLRVGKANTHERLALALRVLETLRRSKVLTTRRVTEVDVADVQRIRFLLDDEMEIRCGAEAELEAHLARLQAVLKAVAKGQRGVSAIDVRFPEPVITPRTS